MTQGLTRRTVTAFAWMSSSSGLLSVLRILVLAVLARLLTPAEFGLVGAGLVVVKFAELFSQLSVGPAIVQLQSIDKSIVRTGFTLALVLATLVSGAIWVSAPLFALFFKMPALTSIVRVLAAVFPLNALAVVSLSLMERDLRFRRIAVLETLSYALGYGALGLLLASRGLGVWALVGAVLGQAVLRAALLLWFEPHPWVPLLNRTALRRLLPFAGGFTLTRVLTFFALQGDSLIVGRWLGGAALGFYGRAYGLAAAPVNLVARVVGRVLFPAMSQIQTEKTRLASAYCRTHEVLALVMMPASVTLLLLAPEIIPLLLGPGWDPIIAPFQVLVAGVFFRASQKAAGALIRATGAVYRQALAQALYALLVVGGCWIAQRWGIAAVAAAVLVAVVVHWFVLTAMALGASGLGPGDLVRSFAPGAVMTLAIAGAVGVVAVGGRSLGLHPALIVGAAAALSAALAVLAFVSAPRFAFARESRQLLQMVLRREGTNGSVQ